MNEIVELLFGIKDTILVLLFFNLLDILSSIPKIVEFGFKSTVFRNGLLKKSSYYIALLAVSCLDYIVGTNGTLIKCLLLLFIGNEAFSILIENLGPYIPLPEAVKDIVNKLKEGKSYGEYKE